jgi:hypothetical protein
MITRLPMGREFRPVERGEEPAGWSVSGLARARSNLRDAALTGQVRGRCERVCLFQLLVLTAMEPPVSFRPDAVRDERVKVLGAITLPDEAVVRDAVRGQYGPAPDGSGVAYRHEPHVSPDSRTDTFVALKLVVDNWRCGRSGGTGASRVGASDEGLESYPSGSWGPAAADALLARDGRAWRHPGP